MPSSSSSPTRRALLAIAAAGVIIGGALYAYALNAARARPVRGALLAWMAVAALAVALGWWRSRRNQAPIGRALPTLVLLLAPSALLLSIPAAYAASLGWTHGLTLTALALAALVPLALALRAAGRDSHALARWRGNAFLAAGSLLLLLLALELGVRLSGSDPGAALPRFRETPFHTVPSAIQRAGWELAPSQEWRTIYPSNERGYFGADNAVSYRTNRQGYRGPDLSLERRPGLRRVALLGDSFAFGLGVKEGDTVARRLEEALGKDAACRAEVLDFSAPGYSTDQEEALLRRRVLRYAPDVAVVWYFLNDVESEGTLAFLGGDDARGFFPLARRVSALARLVGARLDAQLSLLALVHTYRAAYRPTEARWHVVEQAFARMGRTSRERGVSVVVFVHPVLFRLGPDYPFAGVHRQVIDAAQRAGLEAYDLMPAFYGRRAEDLWVHCLDQHPNDVAHALAARLAAERIRALLPPCDQRAR